MYTMLVGRPPFQTKEVKEIYRNIKENRYEFPSSVAISPQAKELIQSLITTQPGISLGSICRIQLILVEMRPTIHEVLSHAWFGNQIPKSIPMSALTMIPILTYPDSYLENKVRQVRAEKSQFPTKPQPIPVAQPVEPRVLAVKQPVKSTSPLAVKKQPSSNIQQSPAPVVEKVLVKATPETIKTPGRDLKENMVPRPKVITPASAVQRQSIGIVQETPQSATACTPVATTQSASSTALVKASGCQVTKMEVSPLQPNSAPGARRSTLDIIYQHLVNGLAAAKTGQLFSAPVAREHVVAPRVFISKWIDYSNKYGLGYQLTNGCMGVYFNDSTSMILAPNDMNVEYLEYARGTDKTVMNRHCYTMTTYPDTVQKKITLMKHFKSYMQENLYKASQYTFVDESKTHNMDFLVKYMRTKHAVLFRLTNRLVQINFFDHTKLILSNNGLVVTYINRERELKTLCLEDIVNGAGAGKKEFTDIASRLKYARDILESIQRSGTSGAASKKGN